MKNIIYKTLLLLFGLITITGVMQAQRDTMYIMKDGILIEKYNVITEIDSIIFYDPTINKSNNDDGVIQGRSKVPGSLDVDNEDFLDMATRAANFIDNNGKVPMIVYTDNSQTTSVNAAGFYYMMARWLRWFKNNGENANPPSYVTIIRNIDGPPAPTGTESGTIYKSDVLTRGKSNADFIAANNKLPNYTLVDTKKYTPEAFFYVMARTIRWYANNNNTFPAYTTVLAVTAPQTWTSTPPETYPWSRVLTVPYTDQPDSYTCGPTSLRMMMAYYGSWYSVSTISNYMASIGDSPYYDGVAPSTITSAASHYGFSPTTQYGWDYLKSAIAAGHPVIANIQILANNYPRYYPGGGAAYSGYSGGHYVVVTGLHANSDGSVEYVVVNDPSKGNVKYTRASFETSWVNNKNRLMIRIQ
ncbi:MAG: Peptidase C39 family protein [Bacteroidetes bacterium ADurb.Bin174]|nr:MAG: Peptidase C39 family protein [Bacteroidetes bacterium ADurb.Bin174]